MKRLYIYLVLILFTGSIYAQKSPNEEMNLDKEELLDIFLKYGKDPHGSALNYAIMSKDIESALKLLDYGREIDLNKRNPVSIEGLGKINDITYINQGQTALELAVESRMKPVIEKLLQKGANPYLPRVVRFSLNSNESLKNNTPVKKLLVENKLTTAVSDAIDTNDVEILKVFHRNGIRFDENCFSMPAEADKDLKTYYTPMQYALSKNKVEAVRFLLQALSEKEPRKKN